jgi:hypothetical protein
MKSNGCKALDTSIERIKTLSDDSQSIVADLGELCGPATKRAFEELEEANSPLVAKFARRGCARRPLIMYRLIYGTLVPYRVRLCDRTVVRTVVLTHQSKLKIDGKKAKDEIRPTVDRERAQF